MNFSINSRRFCVQTRAGGGCGFCSLLQIPACRILRRPPLVLFFGFCIHIHNCRNNACQNNRRKAQPKEEHVLFIHQPGICPVPQVRQYTEHDATKDANRAGCSAQLLFIISLPLLLRRGIVTGNQPFSFSLEKKCPL